MQTLLTEGGTVDPFPPQGHRAQPAWTHSDRVLGLVLELLLVLLSRLPSKGPVPSPPVPPLLLLRRSPSAGRSAAVGR